MNNSVDQDSFNFKISGKLPISTAISQMKSVIPRARIGSPAAD